MEQNSPDVVDDVAAEAIEVALSTQAVKRGESPESVGLTEGRVIHGEYPGSKTRAMGHALALVERLEAVGISAERVYVGEADWTDDMHRIDVTITSVEQEADQ